MILADFHTHSICSNDAEFTMSEMALAANKNGLNILCFTDHCDIEKYDTGEFDPSCIDFKQISDEFSKANSLNLKTELRLGLELGGANHHPDFARNLLSSANLDFVIGSVHNLRDMVDFYCIRYEDGAHCRKLLQQYVDEHYELLKLGMFDVIGHIGYPLRYMRGQGFDVDLAPWAADLAAIFTELKNCGRGIELNTSGFRSTLGHSIPSLSILKLYRERGGEIITVGSDAHTPEHIGSNLDDARELLETTGFRYYCIYRDRKPEFIRL